MQARDAGAGLDAGPSARFEASAATVGGTVLLFGGESAMQVLGDTWGMERDILDPARERGGAGPSARGRL